VDSLESKVKWVAFIANDQEFVAAQDYRHFVTQIIIEKNIVA
jgi:hypothetical protein